MKLYLFLFLIITKAGKSDIVWDGLKKIFLGITIVLCILGAVKIIQLFNTLKQIPREK